MIPEIVPLVGLEYALILNGIDPRIIENVTVKIQS